MASDPKVHAFEEAVKHNKTKDCWLAISGKVYDVTPFMEDHPGGDEVLLSATGKDATNDFEDVGHSDAAREQMEQKKKKKSADRSLLVDVMFLGFSKFAAVVNIAPAAVSKKKKKSTGLVVGP